MKLGQQVVRIWALSLAAWYLPVVEPVKSDPAPVEVFRCFFIYAPILEAAKEAGRAEIAAFAQSRVAWIGGYTQACKNDVSCRTTLDAGMSAIKEFQQRGIDLRARSISAIQNRDQRSFSEIMNEAVACDRVLGVETHDIPTLR